MALFSHQNYFWGEESLKIKGVLCKSMFAFPILTVGA